MVRKRPQEDCGAGLSWSQVCHYALGDDVLPQEGDEFGTTKVSPRAPVAPPSDAELLPVTRREPQPALSPHPEGEQDWPVTQRPGPSGLPPVVPGRRERPRPWSEIAADMNRSAVRWPERQQFHDWDVPVPIDEIRRHGQRQDFQSTGMNPTRKVILPNGKSYFVKVPTNAALLRDQSEPVVFDRASHDAELLVNRWFRLIGLSQVIPMDTMKEGDGPSRAIVTAAVPGMTIYDAVRHILGKPRWSNEKVRESPERATTTADLERLARSVPRNVIGNIAFANRAVAAGDRHSNNYLWQEGDVIPYDYEFSIYPRAATHPHWENAEGLRTLARYPLHVWSAIPVDRRLVESFVAHRAVVLDDAAAYAARHHGNETGNYAEPKVAAHYRRKLDGYERLLREKRGPLTLGDLGIMGGTYGNDPMNDFDPTPEYQ